MSEKNQFWALSMVGYQSQEPRVVLRHQDWSLQVTVAQARSIAMDILQAAEAAVQDHFLYEWSQTNVGLSESAAARLMGEFRKFREGHHG